MKRFTCLSLFAVALWSTSVSADIVSPAPQAFPAIQNVTLGPGDTVSFNWYVVRADNLGSCGNTVYSTSGTFALSGNRAQTVLGTTTTTISQTKQCTFAMSHVVTTGFTIPETLSVPADVIYRANKLGAADFGYTRVFSDGYQTNSGTLTLRITSASGAFTLTTMSLTFDNGSPVRVLERKEKNRAVANLGFNGVGLLQGMWEVADPSSTAGEPVYRPLAQVRQYLNGISPQTIQSPDLPTDRTGLYLVRLRVTDPAPGFELPVIRYFVADERAGVLAPKVPVNVLTPAHPSMLASDTVFAWDEIKGARAYQIEIYAKPRTAGDDLPDLGGAPAANPLLPTTPPVAGMLVHGKQTRATLSPQTRSHLLPGRSYLWRVTALRADGSIAGESAVREMRVP